MKEILNIIFNIISIVVMLYIYIKTVCKMQEQINFNYKIKVDETIDNIKDWLNQEDMKARLKDFSIIKVPLHEKTILFTQYLSIKEEINEILIIDKDIESIFKNMCGNDKERLQYFRAINNFRNIKRYTEKINDKKSQKIIEKFLKMIDSMCEYESCVVVIYEQIEEYNKKIDNKIFKKDLYYIKEQINNINNRIENKQLFTNMKNKIDEFIVEIDKLEEGDNNE